MKARMNNANSWRSKPRPKQILAIPEALNKLAKLRSAGVVSSGTPSSKSCDPVAPSSKPIGPAAEIASDNSSKAESNWDAERTCSKPYNRANFNKTLRLRTKARAFGMVGALGIGDTSPTCNRLRVVLSVLGLLASEMVRPYYRCEPDTFEGWQVGDVHPSPNGRYVAFSSWTYIGNIRLMGNF